MVTHDDWVPINEVVVVAAEAVQRDGIDSIEVKVLCEVLVHRVASNPNDARWMAMIAIAGAVLADDEAPRPSLVVPCDCLDGSPCPTQ